MTSARAGLKYLIAQTVTKNRCTAQSYAHECNSYGTYYTHPSVHKMAALVVCFFKITLILNCISTGLMLVQYMEEIFLYEGFIQACTFPHGAKKMLSCPSWTLQWENRPCILKITASPMKPCDIYFFLKALIPEGKAQTNFIA